MVSEPMRSDLSWIFLLHNFSLRSMPSSWRELLTNVSQIQRSSIWFHLGLIKIRFQYILAHQAKMYSKLIFIKSTQWQLKYNEWGWHYFTDRKKDYLLSLLLQFTIIISMVRNHVKILFTRFLMSIYSIHTAI